MVDVMRTQWFSVLRVILMTLDKKVRKLFVVKAGGDVLDENPSFLQDVKNLAGYCKVVFVYGAQKELDREMEKHGLTPQRINGLRVTTADTMDKVYIPVMTQKGEDIAAILNAGLFLGGVYARKVSDELGFVGEVTHIDNAVVEYLKEGKIAVVSPLAKAIDGSGYGADGLLNCNADNVACGLSVHLKADGLYLATNVEGVLSDGMVYSLLSYTTAKNLISSGQITGGMLQKVINAVTAVEAGVPYAVIFNGIKPQHNLFNATSWKSGTIIYNLESLGLKQ